MNQFTFESRWWWLTNLIGLIFIIFGSLSLTSPKDEFISKFVYTNSIFIICLGTFLFLYPTRNVFFKIDLAVHDATLFAVATFSYIALVFISVIPSYEDNYPAMMRSVYKNFNVDTIVVTFNALLLYIPALGLLCFIMYYIFLGLKDFLKHILNVCVEDFFPNNSEDLPIHEVPIENLSNHYTAYMKKLSSLVSNVSTTSRKEFENSDDNISVNSATSSKELENIDDVSISSTISAIPAETEV